MAAWSDSEIETMLDYFIDNEGYRVLDSKRQRNIELYENVSKFLAEKNFAKTAVQCRTKFKHLKTRYHEERLKMAKSGAGATTWRWFEKLNQIVGRRPIVSAIEDRVETTSAEEATMATTATSGACGSQEETQTTSSTVTVTTKPGKRIRNSFREREPDEPRSKQSKTSSSSNEIVNLLKEQNELFATQMKEVLDSQKKMMDNFSNFMQCFTQMAQQPQQHQPSFLPHSLSLSQQPQPSPSFSIPQPSPHPPSLHLPYQQPPISPAPPPLQPQLQQIDQTSPSLSRPQPFPHPSSLHIPHHQPSSSPAPPTPQSHSEQMLPPHTLLSSLQPQSSLSQEQNEKANYQQL